jgi:transposase-like protein
MEHYDAELKLRSLAIEWSQHRTTVTAICQRLHRSRQWLAKWVRRFQRGGRAALVDRSRRPHRLRAPTALARVQGILALRRELETHRTRRTRFRGVGANEIQDLLQLERRRVPSLSTIERILRRHHVQPQRARRHGGGQPYPWPRATRPGDLQQTDLVGPRYLRGPRGVTRFYSIHTIAIVGRGTWASQVRYKTADALCEHFVAAWAWLGLPRVSQIDNEMAATGGGRHAYGLSLVARVHLLLGVHVIFLPFGEPGRNPFVESFNASWQKYVLRCTCHDLRAVRRVSLAHWRFYHEQKIHRVLRRSVEGARRPGEWLRIHRPELRALPHGFTLARYRDHRGSLHLPIARGRISWIQKVDADGHITINARPYCVGKRLTGHYVQATLAMYRRHLVIYDVERHRLKTFAFPLAERIVPPLVRPSR